MLFAINGRLGHFLQPESESAVVLKENTPASKAADDAFCKRDSKEPRQTFTLDHSSVFAVRVKNLLSSFLWATGS